MSLANKFAGLDRTDGLTYPVTEALARWDGIYTPEAVARVQEVERHDWLTADRSDGFGRIRPSSIGHACGRPALLSFHGLPAEQPSKASRAIMDAGTWRHYWWQLVGLSAGFLTDIEAVVEHVPWRLKGSADGVGDDVGIFELKSVNNQKFAKVKGNGVPSQYKPIREHEEQVNGYMVARGLQWASIIYEERNYLGFIEVRVQRNEDIVAGLDRRFAAWNAHIAKDTMPPIRPDCWSQEGPVFRYCDWKESCFNAG